MILRFKLYSMAGATALFAAPSDGFTPTAFQRTITSRPRAAAAVVSSATTTTTARPASLNPDWDNEDFLSSLGGSKEDREKANEKYYKQTEGRKAMDEWRLKKFAEQQKPAPSQPAAQEEPKMDGPSPEFSQKMGLTEPPAHLTQQRQQWTQPPPPQQMAAAAQMQQPPPPAQQPPPPPPAQQQQYFDANGNPVNMPMVYDQNGNLVPFNPQQQQMQQPAQPTQPQINPGPVVVEPPLPPKTKGTDDPRPVGFNSDAYTMSNTADVYFAQLKQDSKVRKIARMSGDVVTANKVFDDESVKQIGDSWNENPYTKEKNLAEARAEIEGTVRAQTQGDNAPQISSGISYKEQLAMMKAKRAGGGAPTKFVKPAAVSAPPKTEPPVAAAPPKLDQPKVGTTLPPPAVAQPKAEQPMTNAPPTTSTPPPPTVVPPPAKVAVATPAGSMDEDEKRRKVRTLQGLLLKHRGGPGFGAGRLKAPEAQRLEDTVGEVEGILRSEVGKWDAKPTAAALTAPKVESKPAAVPPIASAVTPPPPPTISAKPAVPAPAQAAATASQPAATTRPSATVGGSPDPLAGAVACVEAALKMYKESSPAVREAMTIPLREALMAAASAINKYIAESELSAHKAAMEAGPQPVAAALPVENTAQPMMGFPTTYAVTKPEEESIVQTMESNPAGVARTDEAENEKRLEDAYSALVQFGGKGGKLGLKNISSDEANDLADKLTAMRGVLLDELMAE